MAQKYIIGDLVKVWLDLDIKYQVVEVAGYDPTYQKYILTNWYIEETRGFISVAEDKIKPIRLTRKILKKNGWNKRTRTCYDGEHLEDFSNPSFPLEHFAITFTKEGIKATYDCLPVREVKYVSDLQHLLFGLNINHEMEV